MSACAALVVVSLLDESHGIAGPQSTAILAILVVGIAVRILANQFASAQARDEAREALAHRRTRAAWRRTEPSAASARPTRRCAHPRSTSGSSSTPPSTASSSSTTQNVIVRANEAFAWMIGMDRSMVEGRSWDAVASRGRKAEERRSSSCPRSDRRRSGGPKVNPSTWSRGSRTCRPCHHAGSCSCATSPRPRWPTAPSVRSSSSCRTAMRTGRGLLRRTNAAIEQERNRIARDLHDGPVQGVSAASLSLEAALLMVKAGRRRPRHGGPRPGCAPSSPARPTRCAASCRVSVRRCWRSGGSCPRSARRWRGSAPTRASPPSSAAGWTRSSRATSRRWRSASCKRR